MDNLDLVRRYYELVDAKRVDDLVALFHKEIVYERQGTPTISGIDALRIFYEADRIIESGRHQLEEILTSGGWVSVRGTFEGTLRGGETVTLRFADWLHFRDGQIDLRETYFPGRQV